MTSCRALLATRVAGLHNTLNSVFNSYVSHSGGLFIGQLHEPEGWRSAPPGVVKLHLLPRSGELFYRMAQRERGGDVPVLRLKDVKGAGVSWYEKLQSFGDGTFSIESLSLTLWHDFGAGTLPAQVVRAEWDAAETVTQTRPQPHWHVDVDLPVTSAADEPREEAAPTRLTSASLPGPQGLEEVTGALAGGRAHRLTASISPYHLGMRGAWLGHKRSHTWAANLDSSLADVPGWVRLCLMHLISEHGRFGLDVKKRRAAGK